MASSPSLALPIHDERGDAAATDVSSWRLTGAVQLLRLTMADACLRARDEAHRFNRASNEYWFARGRAHGYQEAAAVLRTWVYPSQHEAVLLQLQGRQRAVLLSRDHAVDLPDVPPAGLRAYQSARAWVLRWAIAQVGELDAHALAWS